MYTKAKVLEAQKQSKDAKQRQSAYSLVTHVLYNNILNRKHIVIRMAVSLKYDLLCILLKDTIWGQGSTSGMGHLLSMLEALVEFPLREKRRLRSKGQVINAAVTEPGSISGKPLYFQSNHLSKRSDCPVHQQ